MNPIKRRKLSDDVLEQILDTMHKNNFKPDDDLPSERELMKKFQIGRPAVREALQTLQHMGIINIRHGERPKIAHPSVEGVVNGMTQAMEHLLLHSETAMEYLKQARIVFETEMVAIAAKVYSEVEVEKLKNIIEKQKLFSNNPQKFLEYDGKFHYQIAVITGNPIFSALSQALFDWLSRFHILMVSAPGLEQLTISEHLEIYEAIRAKKSNLAKKKMLKHLVRSSKLYHLSHKK